MGQAALFKDTYHVDVVRQDLTRNLVALYPEIYEEIEEAFRGALYTRLSSEHAISLRYSQIMCRRRMVRCHSSCN
jgi:hypothetical protein